ncbi:hypothetical protein CKO23_23705 [Thiocystis violacea]|nr:hypothetical protein [Thiocystis violacea]
MDDTDRERIAQRRGDANRLGRALQILTVRFLPVVGFSPLPDPPFLVLRHLPSVLNDHLARLSTRC